MATKQTTATNTDKIMAGPLPIKSLTKLRHVQTSEHRAIVITHEKTAEWRLPYSRMPNDQLAIREIASGPTFIGQDVTTANARNANAVQAPSPMNHEGRKCSDGTRRVVLTYIIPS